NLAEIAVKKSLNDGLTTPAATRKTLLLDFDAAVFVHILHSAANESLIDFYFAAVTIAQLCLDSELRICQSRANALQHEPCGLLRDSDRAVKFPRTDSIFAVNNHPHCEHPLVESESGVLKDAAHLDGELLLATLAVPVPPSRYEGMVLVATTGA